MLNETNGHSGRVAASPEMEAVGPWKGLGAVTAVEVTSGLHQNAPASCVKENFWKWICVRELGRLCIIPSFCFTPGVMQLFI